MSTMTTEELTTAIDAKRTRVTELTEAKRPLEKSYAVATNAVALAIARNRGEDVTAQRTAARSASDQIVEIDSAINLLDREISALEFQRKEAHRRELTE